MRLRVEVDAVEAFFNEYYEDDFSYGKAPGDANSHHWENWRTQCCSSVHARDGQGQFGQRGRQFLLEL